jgi:hypothetical protein
MAIGNAFFVSEIPHTDVSERILLLLMLLASALNTLVIMIMIGNSRWKGLRLAAVTVLEIYGIQFFLSQIETLWFNKALGLPMNLIYALFAGGLITAVLFSPLAVWTMNGFKPSAAERITLRQPGMKNLIFRVTILVVLVYPLLYFLAGYFIAWQFEPVRMQYSGSPEMKSFWEMMQLNIVNGLWVWQIVRGLLWLLIAWPVLVMVRGGSLSKGIIIGLLFAVLMNAQHLLPNPYMPRIMQLAHGIETASSNFLWGLAVAWLLDPSLTHKKNPEKVDPEGLTA